MRSWRPFLLGIAGLDAFDSEAESEPPDRKLGEIEKAVGAGERDAVVGADGQGKPAFAEEREQPVAFAL
jgi:hypothetical protein